MSPQRLGGSNGGTKGTVPGQTRSSAGNAALEDPVPQPPPDLDVGHMPTAWCKPGARRSTPGGAAARHRAARLGLRRKRRVQLAGGSGRRRGSTSRAPGRRSMFHVSEGGSTPGTAAVPGVRMRGRSGRPAVPGTGLSLMEEKPLLRARGRWAGDRRPTVRGCGPHAAYGSTVMAGFWWGRASWVRDGPVDQLLHPGGRSALPPGGMGIEIGHRLIRGRAGSSPRKERAPREDLAPFPGG
jgi:hypothetical protein